VSTVHLDRGERYIEDCGRYRTGHEHACRDCHGTIWRGVTRESDDKRMLRCSGCGHFRPWPWEGVTFEPERV